MDRFKTFMDDRPPMDKIEEFVIEAIQEKLSSRLPVYSCEQTRIADVPDHAIYTGVALFRTNSHFTGNLISDLQSMQDDYTWSNAPEPVKYLFDSMPVYEHSPAPDFIEDDQFYVTNINDQQRKAARSVAEHPLTIVTGPPGSGKSQLVLNLIAQAYLKGQTVLLASHNNKAVDVVMDRLQNEICFQGAVRTGNKEYRGRAVSQMKETLGRIHRPSLDNFEDQYQEGKRLLKETDKMLAQIRDARGSIQSYQQEKRGILEKLPPEEQTKFKDLSAPFNEQDKSLMNEVLSNLVEELRCLIADRKKLTSEIREIIADKGETYPALRAVHQYEDQWGLFAGGLFHRDQMSSLKEVTEFCAEAPRLLHAVKSFSELNQARQAFRTVKSAFDETSASFSEEQTGGVLAMENLSEPEFSTFNQRIVLAKIAFDRLQSGSFGFLDKVLTALRIKNPGKKLAGELLSIYSMLNIRRPGLEASDVPDAAFIEALTELNHLAEASDLLRQINTCQETLHRADLAFKEICLNIPSEITAEFERMDLSEFDPDNLCARLETIGSRAAESAAKLSVILERASSFIIRNSYQIQAIDGFKNQSAGKEWDGFGLHPDLTEDQALDRLQLWQKLLVIWEANAVIQNAEARLKNWPSEEQALADNKKASDELFKLAGQLMQATWYARANETPNSVLTGTEDYIAAVRELSEIDFAGEHDRYIALKDSERRNFVNALQMFPIWAITNLTARTNFPLEPGLFDLLIIDEASQCDIPSALPLIYRAKKVVIIGDQHQLHHVSRLTAQLDIQLGQKYGVGLESYSYRTHSLYDLGKRCAGLQPGAILLNEHYRSDPRIITFSNEMFYDNRLIIKTDLTRRGFNREFLNNRGGAYWLNTKGNFQQLNSRSAFNTAELDKIAELVPALLKALDVEGHKNATIGIVTPFREQENRINNWVGKTFSGNNRIRSGTAHQFQGDECDVIIFSTVMTDGISSRSIGWLEKSYDLLNVALTRARVCLIIVGDFDFCYNALTPKNIYNRLSRYIKDRWGGVYNSANQLPIMVKGNRVEILGTLLDPSHPESNRTNLIRFIQSCQDYVYWIDPYFDQGIVDLFDDLYQEAKIPEISSFKLLTAERQVKSFEGKPKLRPDSIIRLREFLTDKGVDLQMRVLPGEALPHDRFLYHSGGAINMPPFAGAYGKHRHVSEYTASNTTVDMFNNYWEKGIEIDAY